MKRGDGELIKLENVAADDFFVPTLTAIGSTCTIAFVNKSMTLPKELGSMQVKNVIVSVAGENGYILQPEYKAQAVIGFMGVFCAVFAIIALHGWFVGSYLYMFMGAAVAIPTGLTAMGHVSARNSTSETRDHILKQFEMLKHKPLAAKTYG